MAEISTFNQQDFYFEKLKQKKDFQLGTKCQSAIVNGVATLSTLASLYALNNLSAASSLTELAGTASLITLAGTMFIFAMSNQFNQLLSFSKKAGFEEELNKFFNDLEKIEKQEVAQTKSVSQKEGGFLK